MNKSESFKLNKEDAVKILKGTAIAMGGAGITYLLAIFDVINTQYDTPLWVAGASILLNVGQKWITNHNK